MLGPWSRTALLDLCSCQRSVDNAGMRPLLALTLCFLLLACVSKTLLRTPALSEKDFSFEALVTAARPNQTIAGTLQSLRQNFPEDLRNHTFVHHSQSLQQSSFENPRAIVFGQTGHFIFTFNGDPKHSGYNSIEAVSYNPAKGEYDFREIAFKKEPGIIELSPEEIEMENENIVVSHSNPKKCLMCHDFDRPRPVFESYFFWPGFYGSVDDNVFRRNGGAFERGIILAQNKKSDEQKGWESFKRLQSKKSRYQSLGDFSEQLSLREEVRPNLRLNFLLNQQVRDAILLQIFKHPQGPAIAYALMTNLSCDVRSDDSQIPYETDARKFGLILTKEISAAMNLKTMTLETKKEEQKGETAQFLMLMRMVKDLERFESNALVPQVDSNIGYSDKIWNLNIVPSNLSKKTYSVTNSNSFDTRLRVVEKYLEAIGGPSLRTFALTADRTVDFGDGRGGILKLREDIARRLGLSLTFESSGYIERGLCERLVPEARRQLELAYGILKD